MRCGKWSELGSNLPARTVPAQKRTLFRSHCDTVRRRFSFVPFPAAASSVDATQLGTRGTCGSPNRPSRLSRPKSAAHRPVSGPNKEEADERMGPPIWSVGRWLSAFRKPLRTRPEKKTTGINSPREAERVIYFGLFSCDRPPLLSSLQTRESATKGG